MIPLERITQMLTDKDFALQVYCLEESGMLERFYNDVNRVYYDEESFNSHLNCLCKLYSGSAFHLRKTLTPIDFLDGSFLTGSPSVVDHVYKPYTDFRMRYDAIKRGLHQNDY